MDLFKKLFGFNKDIKVMLGSHELTNCQQTCLRAIITSRK